MGKTTNLVLSVQEEMESIIFSDHILNHLGKHHCGQAQMIQKDLKVIVLCVEGGGEPEGGILCKDLYIFFST